MRLDRPSRIRVARSLAWACLWATPALGFTACSDDDQLAQPPPPADAVPGGGTHGGAIQGRATVFIEDATTRGAIAGAAIRLESGALVLEKETDAEGRADFVDPKLAGPIAVHAFARGHAASSLFGADAREVTLALIDPNAANDPEPIATAEGTVSGWERLGKLGVASAAVAFVSPAGKEILAAIPQSVRPGTSSRSNPQGIHTDTLLRGNAMFPTFDRFSVHFGPTATALVVRAGVLTVDPFGPPALELTQLGFRSGIKSVPGATVAADLALTHPLELAVHTTIAQAPESFDNRRGLFSLELPSGEQAVLAEVGTFDTSFAAKAPILSGTLAGGAYRAVAELSSKTEVAGRPEREALATARTGSAEIAIDGFLPVPGAPSLKGRELAGAPSSGATLHSFTLTAGDRVAWTVIAIGDQAAAFALPAAPAGHEDPLPAADVIELRASRLDGIDPNETPFSALEAAVRAASIHRSVR